MRHLLVAVAAIAGLVAGCSADKDNETHGDRRETGGPLVALVSGGGNSLDAPPGRARWTGTFGSLLVCAEDGAEVEIESVSYDFAVRPVAVRPLIRKVPEASERTGRAERWAPMIALRGTVGQLRGAFTSSSLQAPAGVVVSTPCGADGPDDAYTELMTSMTTNGRGGWIEGVTVAYTSGDHAYQLHIDWTYVTCGSAVRDRHLCRSGA